MEKEVELASRKQGMHVYFVDSILSVGMQFESMFSVGTFTICLMYTYFKSLCSLYYLTVCYLKLDLQQAYFSGRKLRFSVYFDRGLL